MNNDLEQSLKSLEKEYKHSRKLIQDQIDYLTEKFDGQLSKAIRTHNNTLHKEVLAIHSKRDDLIKEKSKLRSSYLDKKEEILNKYS